MGLLETIEGTIVGVDTAPLIYLIERHPTYHPLVYPIFAALAAGRFTAITSAITVIETMVHPIRRQRLELATRYREILTNTANLRTYDVSIAIAERAAEIRAIYRFRTPDAIQLATSVEHGATHFLTNDHGLSRFSELRVIAVDDLA